MIFLFVFFFAFVLFKLNFDFFFKFSSLTLLKGKLHNQTTKVSKKQGHIKRDRLLVSNVVFN